MARVIEEKLWEDIKQYIPAEWWSFNNELPTVELYNAEQALLEERNHRLSTPLFDMNKAFSYLEKEMKSIRGEQHDGYTSIRNQNDVIRVIVLTELQKMLLSSGYERKA